MPNQERLQEQIQRLSLADKQALQIWLGEEIEAELQPPAVAPTADREVIQTAQVGRGALPINLNGSNAAKPTAAVRAENICMAPTGMAIARKRGGSRAGTLARS